MKLKQYILPLFLMLTVFLSSCHKEDTTAPVLTLLPVVGGNNILMPLPPVKGGGVWVDPGYVARNNGVDITSSVHVYGTVDPNTKGAYTLTYSVKNAAGIVIVQTRTVHVFNDADSLIANGLFAVVDSTVSPTIAVTSYIVNMKSDLYTDSLIHFDRFAGLFNDSTVTGMVNSQRSTLKVKTQTVTFWPVTAGVNETHTFSGTGTDTTGSLVPTVIHFNYSDQNTTTGITSIHHTRWTR